MSWRAIGHPSEANEEETVVPGEHLDGVANPVWDAEQQRPVPVEEWYAARPEAPGGRGTPVFAAHVLEGTSREPPNSIGSFGARGVLAQVKILLADDVSSQDIVLVARDDASYGPTVLSVAHEYGVPVQAFYNVGLSDTRVGYWLNLLIEAVVGGFPFETTARFLAHPLGPGIPSGRWAGARKAHPKGAAAWEQIGLDMTLLAWPEEDTRAGWLGRLDGLFEAYAMDRKVRPWPREVAALSAAKAAVGSLAEPREETISCTRFVEEVEEVLRLTATAAHPEGKGVPLHTPLSLYGASYRYVFTLGLTEGGFPTSSTDDPVLDYHQRKRLRERDIRLELADERARRERLSFWTLLQVPQERLVLSYPKLVGGSEALPSPYFGLVGVELGPPGPLPAASPEEARRAYLQRGGPEDDAILHRARASWEIERRPRACRLVEEA
jgi:hypothetical protein